jgi:hypothetical protein
MHALTSFLDTAWAARSPFLLVAYLLVRYLERAQPESARLSHAGVLLVGHLLSMVVAAGLNAAGYVTELAEIAALGFELLCIVALATKLCFRRYRHRHRRRRGAHRHR